MWLETNITPHTSTDCFVISARPETSGTIVSPIRYLGRSLQRLERVTIQSNHKYLISAFTPKNFLGNVRLLVWNSGV
jgi:hypothetical protein